MNRLNVLCILLTFLFLTTRINSIDLCSVCKCIDTEDSLFIGCDKANLDQTPNKWPSDFVNDTNCRDKILTIKLNSNNITKLEQFPPLSCRKIALYINNNDLKSIAYAAFKDLKNMYYLNLGQNDLTSDVMRGDIFRGEYSDSLYEPLGVEILHLDHNRLHSLSRKMFAHTPFLKHLYLTNNPLDILDIITISALSTLNKLETLDMSNTGIGVMPDEIMKNMKELKDLRLSGNKFTTIPESLSFIGATLRKLVFDDNLVEELNDNSFLGLWRLESLEVGAMDTLRRVKSDTFGQLVSMKMLHLCHNRNLKDISHQAFDNLKNKWVLKELYIHDNGLTSISGDLVPWDQLVSVNLEDNPWDCDCKMSTILENGLTKLIPTASSPRCLTPLEMSGRPLSTLKREMVCPASQVTNKTSFTTTPFMKGLINHPTKALIGFISVCVMAIIGMALGFCVVYFKNKNRRELDGQPIVYINLHNSSRER